jgi:hypothetical protein
MAHRLSSSLYDDGNKMSKGQEMYLKRMKKSGKWIHPGVDPGMWHQLLVFLKRGPIHQNTVSQAFSLSYNIREWNGFGELVPKIVTLRNTE